MTIMAWLIVFYILLLASVTTNISVPVNFIICNNIVSVNDTKSFIENGNKVFSRSGAPFQFTIGSTIHLSFTSCYVSKRNYTHFQLKSDHFTIFIGVIVSNSKVVYTKAFSVPNQNTIYVNASEMSSRYTFAHEMGHLLGLLHPFDPENSIADLPKVCSRGTSRMLQLEHCPTYLSTCGSVSENLTNIMDYLPEYCNMNYTFTPDQITKMTSNLENKDLIAFIA